MNRYPLQMTGGALRNEHASLNREIEDWRAWWKELSDFGQPHFGEMGDRLALFRDHLRRHFEHEESVESMTMVRQLPSREVGLAADLRDEHATLLGELEQIIDALRACEPEFDCWGQARQAFETFLDRLHAHEEAEERIRERLETEA